MKYLPLIWAALTRKPVRSFLIFASAAIGFTSFGVTIGVNAGMRHLADLANMATNDSKIQLRDISLRVYATTPFERHAVRVKGLARSHFLRLNLTSSPSSRTAGAEEGR